MIFDTSIIIDVVRGTREYERGNISAITVMEILRVLRPEKRRDVFRDLSEMYGVYPVDTEVALQYSELYFKLSAKGRMASDLDLIIASTAKAKNEKIVSKDHDFEKLGDLVEVEIVR
ncbi:MAG: type II toxin-antitoxin system VapC family toxin [Thermoplasmataceae archaeon]